jgi:hypothetical protein
MPSPNQAAPGSRHQRSDVVVRGLAPSLPLREKTITAAYEFAGAWGPSTPFVACTRSRRLTRWDLQNSVARTRVLSAVAHAAAWLLLGA